MPYTLLTAAALGYDLVRRPGGALVAGILLTALTADRAVLGRLAEAHPGAGAPAARYAVTALRAREAAASRDALPPTTGAHASLTAQLHRLRHESIGTGHTVERLLREDILAPQHAPTAKPDVLAAATDVLTNAVLASWAMDRLPATVYAEAVGPYARTTANGEHHLPDLGPARDQLLELLNSPSKPARAITARWADLAVDPPDDSTWAEDMHRACWAAHLSGRTRTVAAAHLLAVHTFSRADLAPFEQRGALWNLLAGAVQATAVADLLDDYTLDALIAPWRMITAH